MQPIVVSIQPRQRTLVRDLSICQRLTYRATQRFWELDKCAPHQAPYLSVEGNLAVKGLHNI
jgi:hypothetical protein